MMPLVEFHTKIKRFYTGKGEVEHFPAHLGEVYPGRGRLHQLSHHG